MAARPEEVAQYLDQVLSRYKTTELASMLGTSAKTIYRWRSRQTATPAYLLPALQQILTTGRTEGKDCSFTFIDLFAGIGGIRKGFEASGGECVFTSEWNQWSQKTYLANFGDSHPIVGDIVPYDETEIPDHDVLLAGFPCQPFSIAGVSKKCLM